MCGLQVTLLGWTANPAQREQQGNTKHQLRLDGYYAAII